MTWLTDMNIILSKAGWCDCFNAILFQHCFQRSVSGTDDQNIVLLRGMKVVYDIQQYLWRSKELRLIANEYDRFVCI